MYHTFLFTTLILSIVALALLCWRSAVRCKASYDMAPLLKEINLLEKEISAHEKTIQGQKGDIAALSNDLANAKSTIADGEVMKNYLKENAERVDKLEDAISKVQKNLDNVTDNYNQRKEQYDEELPKWQSISKLCADLETEKYRLDSAIETAQIDKNRYELEAYDAKKLLAAATVLANSKQAELDNKREELQALNIDLTKKNTELAGLENDIKLAKDKKVTLSESSQELSKEIEGKKARSLELQQQESLLESRVASWSGKSDAGDEIKKECWNDLDLAYPFITTKKSLQDGELYWLATFKKNLEAADIKFSDRIIHAFHTGLKTADYSPLVVLAGISGTGKSLLPELYASAMGMNFLQVAVQPRWDSPQDMLGFYNYMESRYKATDLSRMLWQSDHYNNRVVAAARGNGLNMVLLDEMNLARVEYYFSDMLSKLEVRRGINFDDAGQRRSAELMLECGAANKINKPRSLFMGPNTLFIGTMNEDDSTQSLSDKVIDRANVLRFGQPKNLGAHPNKGAFLDKYKGAAQISLDTWQKKWIQSESNHEQSERLLGILQNVNDAMATIGRPFAHRVYNSIDAYVLNYPAGNQSFEHALADQMEMKVIPKLIGLELDGNRSITQLKELSNIIERGTKDEKLVDAFNEACKNESGFFKWQGVQHQ